MWEARALDQNMHALQCRAPSDASDNCKQLRICMCVPHPKLQSSPQRSLLM